MTTLRPYQQRTIDQLYEWFSAGNKGNPCIVLPTGSGKSHIVAALCKDAIQNWPETRVLMMTHVKELIQQNAAKMLDHWPDAPLGIYSAGLGLRQFGKKITFAGIQSVRNRAKEIGHVDLIIVDECHLISHKAEGGYRKLIDKLSVINPRLRVIGLTATPYRLGHGMIHDGGALFDAIIEPVGIPELVEKGFLAPLHSKVTEEFYNTDGVHKRGGEFIDSELQKIVADHAQNGRVVDEIIAYAGDRKSWLVFCAGVEHARTIAHMLRESGVTAECILGETPKKDRERIIDEFKSGKIKALTNANVLTTGFDYPNLDLLVLLRPTASPGLYVQMAGRGMRIKDHTDHCMVLDFAMAVQTHGPIIAVEPPRKKGTGDPPIKACPKCHEICAISAKVCPDCDYIFPVTEKPKVELRTDDIMGNSGNYLDVSDWQWRQHTSRASGKRMLAATYYGGLGDPSITEYFPVTHAGYAGNKSRKALAQIFMRSNYGLPETLDDLDLVADILTRLTPPVAISYTRDGKYYRVTGKEWT